MAKPHPSNKPKKPSTLVVRLDEESKAILLRAAQARKISVSDYVRQVTVVQAHKEVQAAQENVLVLTPEEQLAFWTALNEPPRLTKAQRELGTIMRGES